MQNRPFMRKSDVVALALFIFGALAIWQGWRNQPIGDQLMIECEGLTNEMITLSSLTQPYRKTIENRGLRVTIEISDTGAAFVDANCPDQTCVKSGKINRVGESAVCLPARISIRLAGKSGGADAVTH